MDRKYYASIFVLLTYTIFVQGITVKRTGGHSSSGPSISGRCAAEVVEEVIERLMQPGEPIRKELLALTRLFASLAFKSQEDQLWLKRRFEMLKDILRETPAFQQILEEGRKEGLELERQRTLQSLRQKLLDLVQVRHSELFSLAQEQLSFIQQVEVLEDLFFKIAIAATVEDARKALLMRR